MQHTETGKLDELDHQIINLGIMAHVDAGKTTVTEGFLFHSNAKKNMGSVDKGTTTTDSLEMERKRGMTIKAATVSFFVEDSKINLIDTPGHMDFIAEVQSSLAVLDGVILVISAKEGVQPQTRVIFNQLRRMKIPVVLFLNKIDRMGVELQQVYQQIKEQLTDQYLLMQQVVSCGSRDCTVRTCEFSEDEFLEQIISCSDLLMEKYITGEEIADVEYQEAIRYSTQVNGLCPVYHGSALNDLGVEELLHAIPKWLLPYRQECVFESNACYNPLTAPVSAYIYKIEWDGWHHKKAYVRVLSGVLIVRKRYLLTRTNEEILLRNLCGLASGTQTPVEYIPEHDIGILYDVAELQCGDFIGCVTRKKGLELIAEPLLHVGISPADPAMRRELLIALKELACEGPFLSLVIKEETSEITVKLFGKLQKDYLQSAISDRYGIATLFDEVKTIRKEKPLQEAVAAIRIYQGNNHHAAGIVLRIEPLAAGEGFQYVNEVSYGDLEKSFQNAVREGVEIGIKEGLSNEVVDVRVTFLDSDYNSVESTPADYRRLAPLVVKNALKQAGILTMEPFMNYHLSAPLGYEKSMISALLAIKAAIIDVSYTEGELHIRGEVPFDTCKDFQVEILSMTEGRGSFDLVFLEYRQEKSSGLM